MGLCVCHHLNGSLLTFSHHEDNHIEYPLTSYIQKLEYYGYSYFHIFDLLLPLVAIVGACKYTDPTNLLYLNIPSPIAIHSTFS
jgi:hypothetical protein